MTQEDRRKAKRFTVVELDLCLQEPEKIIGKVVNLSEGGLLVVSDEKIEEKSILDFRIPFNQTINGQINFDFKAQAVWCNKNSLDPSKYSIGIQFTENPELQTQFIYQMIKVFSPE